MSPRPDVSDIRKKQIITAAMNVFTRLGFHQARMDDIVAESGLSKGTLYWYFKSKDDIITSIMGGLFENELSELKNLLQADGSVYSRLMTFIDISLKDIQSMLRYRPLLFEFYTLAFRQKTVQKALQTYFRQYMAILVPLIQQGIDQGEFHKANASEIAVALGSIFEGTLLLWVYDPETVNPAESITASSRLVLNGLLIAPPIPPAQKGKSMATVFMKWLEKRPADYDRGIQISTAGRLRKIQQYIANHLIQPGMTVLGIGCGTETLTALMASRGAKITAIG